MGRTEELSDFQRGTVIGCHLSNKSVRKISALLELPRSTVGAVIVKWKRHGATTAQPRSELPQNLLFAGAKADMASSTKQQALEHKLIPEINGKAGEEVLQGLQAAGSGGRQRCLDGSGRLLSTFLPEPTSRMSSSCETCTRPEPSQSHCSRCERRLCRECCRICGHCSSSVCSYCSMYKLNYEGRYEESFCHECFQD
uniref:uncharacterized protein isoform X3 n=1 Tax=Myxine glutinosa TaxID=7769 RepID=UPI00358F38DD